MHELRVSRLLEDLAAIAAWLEERGHTRLGLVASSMGGFAATWFTLQRHELVAGCVLVAPAFGFLERPWERLSELERETWRKTDRLRVKNEWVDTEIGYGLLEERDLFRPGELAARWKSPALLFHGVGDDVVPASDSLTFINAVTFPDVELRLLKAGDHRMTAFKDVIAAESIRFFERLADSARSAIATTERAGGL
jgi:alpha-beta hydrolase superfamily lysophospholipase